MSEMVERVARALCDDTLKRWRSPIGVKSEPWREFIPAARAAIEAMRAPGDDFSSYLQLAHDLRPQDWSELIDAALTEPSSPSPGTTE
jgi:hypothetical protein